jgi:hypothetical protein
MAELLGNSDVAASGGRLLERDHPDTAKLPTPHGEFCCSQVSQRAGLITEAEHAMAERSEIGYWIPGQMVSPDGPLARYREPTPRGVAGAYVRAYTSPGDLILAPFCQSAHLIREIQATGRHVLALDFNPVGILSLRMALAPPSKGQLLAAFTRLGDAPKAGEPLRQVLERLYATPCPHCGSSAMAEVFVWDQERGQPVERHYYCPACGERGAGPPEETDIEALERVGGRGLAYWYLADRVSPASTGRRQTVQRLLDLYTPRNLYALAQILIKMEDLLAGSAVAEAMQGALLYCLDGGSALFAADAPEVRPRQLRLPPRYLERNVWECLRQACERLARERGKSRLAVDLSSFLEGVGEEGEGLVHLQVGSLRALSGQVDSDSIPLILAMPPRLDPLFWSLSYLWSGWLYGPEAAEAVEPLLGRRSNDWEWYRQSLQGAFRHAVEMLRPGGHFLLLGQMMALEQEAALLLAASGAGLTLDHALGDGQGGVQLLFRRKPLRSVLPAQRTEPVQGTGGLIARSVSLMEEALVDLLRARGEPTTVPFVRLAAAEALARGQSLPQLSASEEPLSTMVGLWDALEDGGHFMRFDDGRWWLRDRVETALPLADRVEAVVYDILAGTLGITPRALLRLVCERLPGPLTPEAPAGTGISGLVEACLRSYGEEFTPGYWRMAAGETAESGDARAAQVVLVLGRLGGRMGYEARRGGALEENGGYDIIWQEEGQTVHGFLLRWRAQIATDILSSRVAARAEHQYIALPQARVELVQAKLNHDPRLEEVMADGNWQFLKHASLHALATAKEVARHDLRRIVGLEPIIEQGEAQIPLF